LVCVLPSLVDAYVGFVHAVRGDREIEATGRGTSCFDDRNAAHNVRVAVCRVDGEMAGDDEHDLSTRYRRGTHRDYCRTSIDEPFASWINGTPKYVASTTVDSVEHWSNSTLINGSVADFVAELRQQQGGTIGSAGSPTLVRCLIEHGQLDELTLMISPVVAGGGRTRLFPDDAALTKFDPVEAVSTSSGAVIATYLPIR
jgi:dihydrofolate reductase